MKTTTKKMFTFLMAMILTVSVLLTSATALAQEPAPGIQSVTGITTVLTFGQKVTAIAVEYSAIVDPQAIEDPANLDTFTVKDSWYDFRFDAVTKIASDIRNRTIIRMYTNDQAATIPDGVSKPGRFVIIELSPLDYGGNTVRTNPASSSYIKVMTGTTDMKTQVIQNRPVLIAAGVVPETLTVYQPSVWVDPLADQFVYGDYCCQQANASGTVTTDLPYYYYIPPDLEPGHVYPMVVILPGQGMGYYPTTGYSATGHNEKVNVVADIPATAWMQPAWKGTDEKIIVLAPQSRRTGANYEAKAVLGLMDEFMAAHPEVDARRLYFSTVSYGSTTAWAMMQQRPGVFTSGLLTGGFAVSTVQATAIATARPLTPIYITHGLRDPLLRIATTGYYSRDRLRAAYVATGLVDTAGAQALIPFQEYDTPTYFNQVVPSVPGYAAPDNHAVVGPTYTDTAKLTWLLSQVKYTVKFDLNGGDSAPIASQIVMTGNKAAKPADPSRDGYTFNGWYLDAQQFDFNTPINADITLVAHWKLVPGAKIMADPNSPTGYYVRFVYFNPNATRVRLAGDLTLLDVTTGTTRYQPETWKLGRYHTGGTEFLRDMTKDADGNWSATIPMHAGGLSYWYRVDDPTQGWTNKRIWDPTATHPRPAVDPDHVANSTPYRVKNNDVLGAVYVPLDAEKQNDPNLISRATYELPMADPAQRGTVQYIPYTTILGGVGYNLGVYLPAGYDPNRAEPYKVVYLAHGIFGDETDWMVPGNAPNIMDNLIARGEIEPTVLVTMGNHFTGTANLPSYNQQNAANNLVQTILPLIESKYNVSKKREGRAYGGFSMGGMTGGNVMNTYSTTFGFYGFFSGNGSFTQTQYNNIAALNPAPRVPFVFLGNGSFEGSLNAANTVANNFISRGIPAATTQVRGAHDMMTAGQLFTIFARDYLWTIYTVKFDLNGGDSAPIDPQAVMTGFKVPEPADPSRTGYTFTGWYLDGQEFDFNTPITSNITLVAHWKALQTITFGPLANKTFADPPFTVSATASSSLAVSFSASGQCTVSDNIVTLTGIGSCTITASQPGDDNYNPAPSVGASFIIDPAVITTTITPASVQYSDSVTLEASISPASANGDTATGSIEFFINGASVGSVVVDSSGKASLPMVITSAPGNYTVTAKFTSTNANFTSSDGGPVNLTVTQEDVRAYYNGNSLFWTSSINSTSANVTLSAAILDASALPETDPAFDLNAGDIRNATVTFINRDTNTAFTGCSNLPVGLVNTDDLKTGIATCNTTLTADKATGASQYNVGIVVSGYYSRNSSEDDSIITVAQPIPSNFITGGGYLVLTNSAGQVPGTPDSKANFGFNVKYNKSGTNLQGNINLIVRSNGHVYKIKSNALSSMGVNGSQANFSSKASIIDITDPLNPITVEGNATLQLWMTDMGDAGDTLGIQVLSKNGGMWFSSNWDGTRTIEQILGGGNLAVH
jgi:uncharacterized repeat protein (TIGR02543 family)